MNYKYPKTINDLTKDEQEKIAVEMILHDLSSALAILRKDGVDRRIISETIINALSYNDLSEICSDIEAYLRSYKP